MSLPNFWLAILRQMVILIRNLTFSNWNSVFVSLIVYGLNSGPGRLPDTLHAQNLLPD